MVYQDNNNYIFYYDLINDITVPDATFIVPSSSFPWFTQALNASSHIRVYSQIVSPMGHQLLHQVMLPTPFHFCFYSLLFPWLLQAPYKWRLQTTIIHHRKHTLACKVCGGWLKFHHAMATIWNTCHQANWYADILWEIKRWESKFVTTLSN